MTITILEETEPGAEVGGRDWALHNTPISETGGKALGELECRSNPQRGATSAARANSSAAAKPPVRCQYVGWARTRTAACAHCGSVQENSREES